MKESGMGEYEEREGVRKLVNVPAQGANYDAVLRPTKTMRGLRDLPGTDFLSSMCNILKKELREIAVLGRLGALHKSVYGGY
jgi:hypothetical protein